MKLGGLLLLLGSCALWSGLRAAPARRTAPGASPPSSGSPARARECSGIVPTDAAVSMGEALCAVAAPAMAAGRDSLLAGRLESQGGQRGCGSPAFPRETAGPKEAGAAPSRPGKRPCGKPPQSGAGAAASPAGKPLGGPEQDALRDEGPQPGRGRFSGGTPVPGERPTSAGSPGAAPPPAPPGRGGAAGRNATTGAKPAAAGAPAPGAQQGRPGSAPAGRPCPRPGGKPASPAGNSAHLGPPPGEKPAPSTEHAPPDKPASAGKPASCPGQAPHATPTAPHGKPGAGAKPAAGEGHTPGDRPKTEAASSEKGEEENGDEARGDDEDAFDVEEGGGGGGEGSEGGGDPDAGGGDPGEADDALDKELDYGLSRPPSDAYAYHDAWSEDDSDDPAAALEGPQEWPSAFSAASSTGAGIFDAWGDPARAPPA